MSEPIYDYDPANYLNSPEEIETFLLEAFSTGDSGYIAEAIGVAARAKGMADVARETGLSREQLYRSFSGEGSPTLKTLLVVLQALGLSLKPSLV
ncbi:addiction module antidote protein [Endozoicomonas sp. ONNA2]|uniref:addiction module antidote protein n=1 Tax=Endozoicomonas sp. ONNA2 TaxID=2828741 RepID=UPI0021476809|nr:addiction module antidote protein [Endozoicomonas sp. ONNA2]